MSEPIGPTVARSNTKVQGWFPEKSINFQQVPGVVLERVGPPPISAVMTTKPSSADRDRVGPKPDQPAGEPGAADKPPRPREIGGPKGPEPTRYGDWEIGGRCIDF